MSKREFPSSVDPQRPVKPSVFHSNAEDTTKSFIVFQPSKHRRPLRTDCIQLEPPVTLTAQLLQQFVNQQECGVLSVSSWPGSELELAMAAENLMEPDWSGFEQYMGRVRLDL